MISVERNCPHLKVNWQLFCFLRLMINYYVCVCGMIVWFVNVFWRVGGGQSYLVFYCIYSHVSHT